MRDCKRKIRFFSHSLSPVFVKEVTNDDKWDDSNRYALIPKGSIGGEGGLSTRGIGFITSTKGKMVLNKSLHRENNSSRKASLFILRVLRDHPIGRVTP